MMMRIGMIVFGMTFWIYRFDSWRFLVFFVNTSGFSVVRACLIQIGRSVNSICIVITIRTLHLDSIFFQRKKLFKCTALLTFKLVQWHMVLYCEKLRFQHNIGSDFINQQFNMLENQLDPNMIQFMRVFNSYTLRVKGILVTRQ